MLENGAEHRGCTKGEFSRSPWQASFFSSSDSSPLTDTRMPRYKAEEKVTIVKLDLLPHFAIVLLAIDRR